VGQWTTTALAGSYGGDEESPNGKEDGGPGLAKTCSGKIQCQYDRRRKPVKKTWSISVEGLRTPNRDRYDRGDEWEGCGRRYVGARDEEENAKKKRSAIRGKTAAVRSSLLAGQGRKPRQFVQMGAA